MKRRKRVWLSEAVSWRESWTAQPNLSSACYFDGELDLTPPQHRSGQLSTKLAWQPIAKEDLQPAASCLFLRAGAAVFLGEFRLSLQ